MTTQEFGIIMVANLQTWKRTMAKKKKKVSKTATKKTTVNVSPQSENALVHFETTQGNFIAEIFSDVPVTADNFLKLVSENFYDGLIFHRFEPNFVIQGGDPEGTGMGGSNKRIPLEITAHQHEKGALGMARSQDPNSASSQFYVCLSDAHFLNNNYAVFGRVVEGFENVLKLRKNDKMIKVTKK